MEVIIESLYKMSIERCKILSGLGIHGLENTIPNSFSDTNKFESIYDLLYGHFGKKLQCARSRQVEFYALTKIENICESNQRYRVDFTTFAITLIEVVQICV